MYFLWFVIVLNYNAVSSPAISSSSCISCLDNSTAKSYKQKEKIKIDTTPITDYLKSIDMTTLAAEKPYCLTGPTEPVKFKWYSKKLFLTTAVVFALYFITFYLTC